MDEPWKDGTWLLVDAAGPESVIGLLKSGEWLASDRHEGDFLEWHASSLDRLLQAEGLALDQLQGTIYGSGPGSTLGLRLAAMFIRSMMQLPALRHWRCFQYQNLELALAAGREEDWREAVAPWRKNLLHHAKVETQQPPGFSHSSIDPGKAAAMGLPGIILGRRPSNADARIRWHGFQVERIPEVLLTFPGLLVESTSPRPYAAEDSQFAKWSPKRHSAK
jgi:hypothetical protein